MAVPLGPAIGMRQLRSFGHDRSSSLSPSLGLNCLPSATLVRVITQFSDNVDPDRPCMYHCRNLEHEDAGMMGELAET